MSKPENFGGIPSVAFDKIVVLFTTSRPAGVTDADAVTILTDLARERTAALNPGSGQTGFVDAFKALDRLDAAITALSGGATPPTIGELSLAIKSITALWVNGPVADEFFSVPKS